MGNLTTAVESVEYERHVSEDIIATAGSMQGFRLDMEDDLTICLRLPKHPNYAFVGVYDGHSGSFSSACLAFRLWREVDKLNEITKEGVSEILLQMDLEWSRSQHRFSGSTVVFAIIERPKTRNKTYKIQIGWVGDSRAFAVKKGRLNDLTVDHKPDNPEERKRIELAGGSVSLDNRVDGELAMSRAFGDWNLKSISNINDDYKKNKVICIPDYQYIELEEGDCLLLSCDGLTEQLENKEIYDELLELQDRNPKDADVVIDGLLQKALRSGSKDNMTSVLVEFRDGTEFRKRDSTREHTVRPGPLMECIRSNQFFDAYIKNVKSMGLWDSHALRKAGFLRDLKRAEEESKVVDRLSNDVVAKRNKYEKTKESIEKQIDELENERFEITEEPEVASYSAFRDTEFLLPPSHEDHIAFLPEQEECINLDEKKDEQKRVESEVLYFPGESVTITVDQDFLKRECLQHDITFNDDKLNYLGKLGSVEAVEKSLVKVRFKDLKWTYLPFSVLKSLSGLNRDVKETLEYACKKLNKEANNRNAQWNLTLEQVRELIAIMYPDMKSRDIRQLAKRWKDGEGITQSGLYKIFEQIQEKDEKEMSLVIKRLNHHFI